MTACMRTFTLQNGRTKVPAKTIVYKNKAKFDKSLLNDIDTGVVYEKFNKQYNVLQRLLDSPIGTGVYGAYRFYLDGRFNLFFIRSDEPLNPNDFNPEYNGSRGVYYLKGNTVRYDLFAPSNGLGWIGKSTGNFTFSGDTLYVNDDDISRRGVEIYIKRKLPPEYFKHKADW